MIKVINFLGNRIGSGGIESFVTNMSEGMIDSGIDYTICVNYKTANIYEFRLRKNGANVVYLRKRPVNYILKLFDFIQYISKNKDAILYLHASTPGMYLHAFLAKCLGVSKIVYHIHSTPGNRVSLPRKIKDSLLRYLFSGIPQINVACSLSAGNDFFKEKEYRIVHNGIDVERFKFSSVLRKQTRKELDIGNEFLLVQIGRFSAPKNQFFTLEMMKNCINKTKKLKLLFIGEGQYEKGMREFIKENGLEDCVIIIPPDKNVERFYMAADLLMFPSEFEGLGIVALEAEVSGLPILASSCFVDEVCFTNFIERINLNDFGKWEKRINEYSRMRLNREELSSIGYKECINKGFSINNGRKELVKIYNECEVQENINQPGNGGEN